MISGISKKVIFFSFLFVNLLQPSKSAEFEKINKNITNRSTQSTWLKLPSVEGLSYFYNNPQNTYCQLVVKPKIDKFRFSKNHLLKK